VGDKVDGCPCMKSTENNQDLYGNDYSSDSDSGSSSGISSDDDDDNDTDNDSVVSVTDSDNSGYYDVAEEDEKDKVEPVVNSAYKRPSVVAHEDGESNRGGCGRLCLSICRHGDECAFNEDNITKIESAVKLIPIDNLHTEDRSEQLTVIASSTLIDDKEFVIVLRTAQSPAFCLGSSVYEFRAYDTDHASCASPPSAFDDTANQTNRYDMREAIERATKLIYNKKDQQTIAAADADSTHDRPSPAKPPCGKAYLTVTTSASPWPCVLKTPPKSDVSMLSKEGEYASFVLPLPCSYSTVGPGEHSSKWRSMLYTLYGMDRLRACVKPKGKTTGYVLNSGMGDETGLTFDVSTSTCATATAQDDFSKILSSLEKNVRNLDALNDMMREAFQYMDALVKNTPPNPSEAEAEAEDEDDEDASEERKKLVEEHKK